MSHNVLNIGIVANFVASYINTKMSNMHGKSYSKWPRRVMLLRHPQGSKQKLGLQAHDYGLCSFSSVTWHSHCYATSKI